MTVWVKEWRSYSKAERLDLIRLTVCENIMYHRRKNALLVAGKQPRKASSKGSDQYDRRISIA